jgi:hypothetical protein
MIDSAGRIRTVTILINDSERALNVAQEILDEFPEWEAEINVRKRDPEVVIDARTAFCKRRDENYGDALLLDWEIWSPASTPV